MLDLKIWRKTCCFIYFLWLYCRQQQPTDSQCPGRKKLRRKEKKPKSCRTSCRKLLLCRPWRKFLHCCFKLFKWGFKYLEESSLCFLHWVVFCSRFYAGLVPRGCLDKINDGMWLWQIPSHCGQQKHDSGTLYSIVRTDIMFTDSQFHVSLST